MHRRLPPLQFFFVAHPDSKPGQAMATALLREFYAAPGSSGLRVPSFLAPLREAHRPPSWDDDGCLPLDQAEHSVVVCLVDERMTRTIQGEKGAQWKAYFQKGVQQHRLTRAPYSSPHRVYGVALGTAGFAFSEGRNMIRAEGPPLQTSSQSDEDYENALAKWVREEIATIALQITIEAIALLNPDIKPRSVRPPIKLFLSHAKADYEKDKENHPLYALQQAISELPIDGWFDAADIPPSSEFANAINEGIEDCSLVVAFLTDNYAARPWCQLEILEAKALGAPILVADHLENGEPRNFPYLGNLPTVHVQGETLPQAARRILERAVRECLRHRLTRTALQGWKDEGEVALPNAPEALTLFHHPDSLAFLYPDPPLAKHELDILEGLRPGARFRTPFSAIAQNQSHAEGKVLAVSISESPDLEGLGLDSFHYDSIASETYLYLLLAGLRIAYGGRLDADQTKENFTFVLFNLVRDYSELATQIGGDGIKPILNYAPWPLWETYKAAEKAHFGTVAELIEGKKPSKSEVPNGLDAAFRKTESITPEEQRLAWTRGLTLMRAKMNAECHARLVLGGKTNRYSGLYPGIVEEAWMSLVTKKPLFLVGAFGGAAQMIIDILEKKPGAERALAQQMLHANTDPTYKSGTSIAELTMALAENHQSLERYNVPMEPGGEALQPLEAGFITPDAMARSIATIAEEGLTDALNNGLEDDENRILFRSTDPMQIAELVLQGIEKLRTS